ncbi:MAG: MGMT family protein [Pseudomonadota bacterium]
MNTADELKPRILTLISHIPKGKVATYGQLASLAGAPSHARLVGRILRELPPDTRLPWFRVISASGRISNPNAEGQRRRLQADGVTVSSSDRITLAQFQWRP